jgi:hypothetical protein
VAVLPVVVRSEAVAQEVEVFLPCIAHRRLRWNFRRSFASSGDADHKAPPLLSEFGQSVGCALAGVLQGRAMQVKYTEMLSLLAGLGLLPMPPAIGDSHTNQAEQPHESA